MSYIRAPKLHQSTARLCPLLIRISGALRKKKGRTTITQQIPQEVRNTTECAQLSNNDLVCMVIVCDIHVFDSATEGVGHRPVVDGLFAKTKVCQLYMS